MAKCSHHLWFLKCPVCPELISHPAIDDEITELRALYDKIKEKSLFRLKVDGMLNDDKLTNPGSKWYKQPVEYAMNSSPI